MPRIGKAVTCLMLALLIFGSALVPSTYVYSEDVGFVWSNSDDLNMLALKEFAHRTIMQNYATTYLAKQKISNDKGNWLVDGISNYVAARISGEQGMMIMNQLDSFNAQPTPFEWYGAAATPSQYGATYTLFKFLTDKYGDGIIDKVLSYLRTGMVSNHRCLTFEQCALVRGVYDANGLNFMLDKKHSISFATIMQEWKDYLHKKYGISEDKLRFDYK